MSSDPQEGFRALSDPTRRAILIHLSQHDMSIGDVVAEFDVTRGAIKKHLLILEQGDLISVRTQGRERINHLELHGMKAVRDWFAYFDQFWDERLGALKQAIENKKDDH